MTEGIKLTEAEQAKEYVEFYYFWRFNYCARNYRRAINRLVAVEQKISDKDKKREVAASEKYWEHPLSKMSPNFGKSAGRYTSIDGLLSDAGGIKELSCDFLKTLISQETVVRKVVRAQSAVELLGVCKKMPSGGYLGGEIVAKIDLSEPTHVILFELSRLRKASLKSFSSFFCPSYQILPKDYIAQRDLIKNTLQTDFSQKAEAGRAIGLWFWDAVDGSRAIFKNFSQAWKAVLGDKAIKTLTGEALPPQPPRRPPHPKSILAEAHALVEQSKREEKAKWKNLFFDIAAEDRPQEIFTCPSLEAFKNLKYTSDEERYFRRLYDTAKACIEACEVLPTQK